MKPIHYVRWLATVALTVFVVGGVAACGDDNSDGGGGGGATSSGKDKAVEVGAAYVGGAAGKADSSKAPISIGWINQDQSPAGSLPENTDALKAAIKFVNEDLGGIDGHPIKLVQCTVGASEQQGKQCAQKYLNDPDIKAVMYGYMIVGGQSFMATMAPDGKTAQKPIVGFGPGSPADGAIANVYFTSGGFLAAGIHPYFMRDYFKSKSVSQIWSDAPALTPFIADATKGLEAAGLKVSTGRIPAAGTDVVGPMVAGGVKTADSVQMNPDDTSQCIAMAKGAKQLGILEKPTLGYSSCLVPGTKDALGDYPKWTYYRDALSPNVPDPSGQVDTFKYAAETFTPADKQEAVIQGPYSPGSFGAVMLLAKWLNAVGPDDVTPAAIAEQAKALTGPIFLGYPEPKFGTQPFPSIASIAQRYYTYEGDGKWTDATNGKWLTQPAQ